MTIQPTATLPQSQSGATAPSTTQTGTAQTSSGDSPDNVSENQFLQLLVAQIQYQDPTNPTDSTAFVTQLAQFSSLEQLVAIHSDLDSLTSTSAAGTQNSNAIQGGN
jgi:flagellar basal-body rod modification protein FlgD